MGVKGLWKLLESTGKAVSLESLSGKVLAIDISMWLHQLAKGMRDSKGQPIKNAHLIGLFKRICKLLFFGIKPIFVFDGSVPALKRQTIASRQKRRSEASLNSKQSLKKMLSKMLQKYALSNIAGSRGSLEVNKQGHVSKKQNDDDDIFKLPTTEYPLMMNRTNDNDNDDDGDHEDNDSDKKLEESSVNISLEDISNQNYDFDSEDFKNLPNGVRLELLTEYKDKCKQTSWENISLLPKDADDFSGYQIRRLMNLNKITKQIDSVRQDSNKGVTNEEGDEDSALGVSHIASRDDVRFVYAKRKNQRDVDVGGKKSQIEEDSFKNLLKKYSSCSYNNNVSNITRNFAPYVLDSSPTKDCYLSQVENKMNEKFLLPVNSMRNISSVTPSLFIEDSKNAKLSLNSADDEDEKDSGNEEDFSENKAATNKTEAVEAKSINELYISIISNKNSTPVAAALPPSSLLPSVTTTVPLTTSTTSDTTTTSNILLLASETIETITHSAAVELSNDTVVEIENRIKPHTMGGDFSEDIEKSKSISENDDKVVTCDEVVEEKVDEANMDFTAIKDDDVVVVADDDDNINPLKFTEVPETIEDDDNVDEEDEDMNNNVREMINDVLEKAQKDNNETVNISAIEDQLSGELLKLQEERGKQERLASSISDMMNAEAQDLLRLFGIPYVVSPAEAEAQCAFLDQSGQTEGTISDDSDSFLFGAKNVIKNLFSGDDVAELYNCHDIEKRLLLDRFQLICVGMLCGSDYTDGVRGVGPITAVEIIHEFKGQGMECLVKFKEWWSEAIKAKKVPLKETKVKSKLRQLHLHESFPSKVVYEAYTNAAVDESKESFQWGDPQFEELERYALKTLSWTKQQVDDLMVPLMKKLQNENASKQKGLTDYFEITRKSESRERRIKSKRLRQVINLKSSSSQLETSKDQKNSKQNQKTNQQKVVTVQEMNLSEESDVDVDDADVVSDDVLASINIDDIVSKSKPLESVGKSKAKKKRK